MHVQCWENYSLLWYSILGYRIEEFGKYYLKYAIHFCYSERDYRIVTTCITLHSSTTLHSCITSYSCAIRCTLAQHCTTPQRCRPAQLCNPVQHCTSAQYLGCSTVPRCIIKIQTYHEHNYTIMILYESWCKMFILRCRDDLCVVIQWHKILSIQHTIMYFLLATNNCNRLNNYRFSKLFGNICNN